MPQDLAAERGVIAGVINHGVDSYYEVSDIIKTNVFSIDINQLLWKCIEHIYTVKNLQIADLASIFSSANDLGIVDILNKPEERNHIRAILNFSVERSNIRKLAIKVRKLALARESIQRHKEAEIELENITGNESIAHILSVSESKILDRTDLVDGTHEPTQFGKNLDDYLNNVMNNPREMVGIPTGFTNFDRAIGDGLRPGVSLIAARIKTGKSFLAQNISYNIASKVKIPVLYGDTEMLDEEKYPRMLAMISNVKIREIEKGFFKNNENKLNRIKQASNILKNLPLKLVNLISCSFEDILSIVRRWILKDVGLNNDGTAKPCVFVLDYFKLSSETELGDLMEWQRLGEQCKQLHDFCMKYKLPCLSFAQLNKEKHIASSDRVLWSVSNYSILEDKSVEEISDTGPQYGNKKLIPKHLRHGEGLSSFDDYINVYLNGSYGIMKEGFTRNQLLKDKNLKGFSIDEELGPIEL